MIWAVVIAIIVLIVWYAISGRAWLKSQSWAKGFFAWIEPIELALYQKSETILVGRLLWVGSGIVTFYDTIATFVTSLDLTPLTTRIFDTLQIPPDMRNLSISAFIGIVGLLINWLRKRTTKPLELVAIPEAKITPAAAAAIVEADAAKQQAVSQVKAL